MGRIRGIVPAVTGFAKQWLKPVSSLFLGLTPVQAEGLSGRLLGVERTDLDLDPSVKWVLTWMYRAASNRVYVFGVLPGAYHLALSAPELTWDKDVPVALVYSKGVIAGWVRFSEMEEQLRSDNAMQLLDTRPLNTFLQQAYLRPVVGALQRMRTLV